MFERIIVGGHAVRGSDSAQGADVIIRAAIAHHAHRLDWQENSEGLPDLVVQPSFSDFVEIDVVGLAQAFQFLGGDLTGKADGEARTGKGMTADKSRRQSQFTAQGADFILEQFAQRFDQFQFHVGGQAADIVVALDGDRRPAGGRDTFDHIGI